MGVCGGCGGVWEMQGSGKGEGENDEEVKWERVRGREAGGGEERTGQLEGKEDRNGAKNNTMKSYKTTK